MFDCAGVLCEGFHRAGVKLRRTSSAATLPVSLRQRKCLPTGDTAGQCHERSRPNGRTRPLAIIGCMQKSSRPCETRPERIQCGRSRDRIRLRGHEGALRNRCLSGDCPIHTGESISAASKKARPPADPRHRRRTIPHRSRRRAAPAFRHCGCHAGLQARGREVARNRRAGALRAAPE